jgi:predicted O-methyltransferase YrrM
MTIDNDVKSGVSAEWVARLFEQPDLLRMGHSQSPEDLNLGLGWLYYALGRVVRAERAVIIGSLRGFVPMMFAKALQDNLKPGKVIFIDPSLADDFWRDPSRTEEYFRGYGLRNIEHFCMTTQEFTKTEHYRDLGEIGLLFIDSKHTAEQAAFDYEAFSGRLTTRGLVMFHDSMIMRPDKVYGADNAYMMTVKTFVDRLKTDPSLQLLDLPFGDTGLTVLRKLDEEMTRDVRDWLDGEPPWLKGGSSR